MKTAHEANSLEIVDIPCPHPGPDEVLLRVVSASVCGSDLHAYLDHPSYQWVEVPVVLGHEFSAIVESAGFEVQGFQAGDHVVVEAIQGCGACPTCRTGDTQNCQDLRVIGLHFNGGFAQFVVTKARYLHRVPADLDLQLACLIEPLSVAYHAVTKQSEIRAGDQVVVMGPGPIGILTALIAKMSGADVLVTGTAVDEKVRLQAVRDLGLTTVNVQEADLQNAILEKFDTSQVGCVFECSGSPAALKSGLGLLKKGGQLTMVGLFPDNTQIDISSVVRREIRVHGSYASNSDDYEKCIRILTNPSLDLKRIVSWYPFEEYTKAFTDALNKDIIKPVFQISEI